MFYYCIIGLPILLVLLRLVVTNILIPYFKKKEQIKQLSQRTDWSTIACKTSILERLYQNVHAKASSIGYRFVHWIQDKEFVYGEIDFLSFYTLLERTSPSTHDVFYDLGSGSGKAVLSALLFFHVKKSIGIELLPPLYEQSKALLEKAILECQHQDIDWRRVEFVKDSFLKFDFGDADIIYVAATCLTDATWKELISKLARLKPGSRIIVTSRKIYHKQFEPIYQGVELMSWGLCPVTLYQIKPFG